MSHKMLRQCIVKVSPVLGVHFPVYVQRTLYSQCICVCWSVCSDFVIISYLS